MLVYHGLSAADTRWINHFHTVCLRKLTRIRWQDKIPDTEVLSWVGIPSIHTLLEKAQARWAGHILHMDDQQLPKVLLYFGEWVDGKRAAGWTTPNFNNRLKTTWKALKYPQNPGKTWQLTGLPDKAWGNLVQSLPSSNAKLPLRTRRTTRKAREASRSGLWRIFGLIPLRNMCVEIYIQFLDIRRQHWSLATMCYTVKFFQALYFEQFEHLVLISSYQTVVFFTFIHTVIPENIICQNAN